jgi:PIN domain nuclease of toxin-antitoxin system
MWYWWVRQLIEFHRPNGLALSIISVWEVAKKHALGKLELDRALSDWLDIALKAPNLAVLPLSKEIIVDATSLPEHFRSDPADELILATSRVLGVPLLTADRKLADYPHVTVLT